MTRHIALLRGINVGKANRIAMADWRALMVGLGYTDVATLLNSGNAVFTAGEGQPAQHAQAIQTALQATLDLQVPVVVKTATEWAAIVAGNTLAAPDADPSRLLVTFAQEATTLKTLSALQPLLTPDEPFLITPHASYLYCGAGILESKAGKALMGKVGAACTTRNWATVQKLQGLL